MCFFINIFITIFALFSLVLAWVLVKIISGQKKLLIATRNDNLTGVSNLLGSVEEITEGGNQTDPRFESAGLEFINRHSQILLNRIVSEAVWTLESNAAPSGGDYGIRLYLENLPEVAGKDNTFTVVKREAPYNDYADFTFGTSRDDFRCIPERDPPGRLYAGGNGYGERNCFDSFSNFI